MLAIIQAFLNIALRRLGPEDLPDSNFLLGVTFIIYLLTQLPMAWIVFGSTNDIARILLVDATLLIFFLWALLSFTGHRSRLRQTLTAVAGTGALLSILSIPFNVWYATLANPETGPLIPSVIIALIVLWSFVIDGHIISRAIARPFVVGLMIAIAYFFVHTTLLYEFSPLPQ
jgi:predicted neutral ceramidase superfamily lipid hydrolase